MKKRALISVSDKTGLSALGVALDQLDFEIIATGGTAKALAEVVPVTDVSKITQFPEIMDGRVKTLHPAIHAGLLARVGLDDEALKAHDFAAIDIVVVNLYPFEKTIANENTTHKDAIENIDIGGPTMIRAAAKNHQRVAIVVDPDDYSALINKIRDGELDHVWREQLAHKAFQHVASYDSAIANYFAQREVSNDAMPSTIAMTADQTMALRYGENPSQKAGFFHAKPSAIQQHQGKALSYNNLLDAHAAYGLALEHDMPTAVVIKHNTPCGVASHNSLAKATELAFACDPESSFGGILAFNQTVDASCAQEIAQHRFLELVICPAIEKEALAILSAKKALRVVTLDENSIRASTIEYRQALDGWLIQSTLPPADQLNGRQQMIGNIDKALEQELAFAWRVCAWTRSNAIVISNNMQAIGIGGGQTSRVDSVRQALERVKRFEHSLDGAVLASDGFFPFRDNIDLLAGSGIRAIIQPGGSKRDQEVIDAVKEHGIDMIMTGQRCFRH